MTSLCPACGKKTPVGSPACECGEPSPSGAETVLDSAPPRPQFDQTAALGDEELPPELTQAMEGPPRDTAASAGSSRWSDVHVSRAQQVANYRHVAPGAVWGGRYEILRSLGEGGMGAVFQAADREIDRFVALKLVRPELSGDPEIMRRFRQELVLARQVTHENVVRIFDLGAIDGLRFISMEFISGKQLSDVLEEHGKLAPKRAAEIMLQVCRGLAAAHGQGVVHRDLKPQNIMLEAAGDGERAVVMDFGIARASDGDAPEGRARPAAIPAGGGSAAAPAATQVGALLGTPMYMSPEQARHETADHRSDLFTVGLIFYELLTGQLPFLGKSLRETLRKRLEETAPPPSALAPEVPQKLNGIVLKCLERDVAKRYQSAAEIVEHLERFLGLTRPVGRWKWVTGSAAAALLAIASFIAFDLKYLRTPEPKGPIKVLIADFDNRTNDAAFTGSLEPMLSIAMEGASFVTSFNRGQAHKLAEQLRPGTKQVDATLARLIAGREAIDVVIAGSIERKGDAYRISAEAIDPARGAVIKKADAVVAGRQDALKAIGPIASRLRQALGDATPESARLAAAETFSSASLEAAQRYAAAQDMQWKGQWKDALRAYEETARLDANFGRAYAGMGAVLANMGRRDEAEKYYKAALAKLDRMSEREKYRTRGGYYLLMRKDQQALEQFKALATSYPADTAGIANLALAYFYLRDMPAAMREGRRSVALSPQNVLQRNNLALYALYAGEFDTVIQESREILKLNPEFAKAYLCIALAQAGQRKVAEAERSWEELAKLGGEDNELTAALGRADLAEYEGRYSDAVALLEPAATKPASGEDNEAAAVRYVALAEAYLRRGSRQAARAMAEKAAGASSEPAVLFPAAAVLIDAGSASRAHSLADALGTRWEPEPQAYAHLIDGLARLRDKDYRAAVASFRSARTLSDTWTGRMMMGQAYLEAGAFAEAEAEFDACVRRRGEASSVFLDDNPTLRYYPAAEYYLGLARLALDSGSGRTNLRNFLQMKARSEPDPLVADARMRAATR